MNDGVNTQRGLKIRPMCLLSMERACLAKTGSQLQDRHMLVEKRVSKALDVAAPRQPTETGDVLSNGRRCAALTIGEIKNNVAK